jgi:hypothetical protein
MGVRKEVVRCMKWLRRMLLAAPPPEAAVDSLTTRTFDKTFLSGPAQHVPRFNQTPSSFPDRMSEWKDPLAVNNVVNMLEPLGWPADPACASEVAIMGLSNSYGMVSMLGHCEQALTK